MTGNLHTTSVATVHADVLTGPLPALVYQYGNRWVLPGCSDGAVHCPTHLALCAA